MTPDFPPLAPLFARQLHRLRTTTGAALQAWEALLQAWIPRPLLALRRRRELIRATGFGICG